MRRAITATKLIQMDVHHYNFKGAFKDAFGKPEKYGTWFVWGNSGNGKTRFTVQLAKEMTRFGRVAYNSLEEGIGGTMQQALIDEGINEKEGKMILVNEDMNELEERMNKQRSPNIVIIDSLQYTGINFKQYKRLKEKFNKKKLFIYLSHAEGKHPRGQTAKSIMYDASLKIWIQGYRAFSKGRFYGNEAHYTIWEKGAERYWR